MIGFDLSVAGKSVLRAALFGVSPLDPGTYQILLEADGYAPWTGKAEVSVDKTTDLEILLEPVR